MVFIGVMSVEENLWFLIFCLNDYGLHGLVGINCIFPYVIAGNTNENYKVDLNIQADASGDDEDDIDWEEGWREYSFVA